MARLRVIGVPDGTGPWQAGVCDTPGRANDLAGAASQPGGSGADPLTGEIVLVGHGEGVGQTAGGGPGVAGWVRAARGRKAGWKGTVA